MIATNQQQPDGRCGDFARCVGFIGGQHQGLDGLRQWQTQQVGHIRAGALTRRRHLGEGCCRRAALVNQRQGFGQFHVGSVVAGWAVHDGVFARVRDHLELMRPIPTDGARVGGHRTELQAQALKDARIRRKHPVIGLACALHVPVEGVGILHRELAPAHHPKTWTTFVAKLRLNLIEILGQLAVAAQLLAGDVGDDLFGRGLDHEVAAMPVLEPQQLLAHALEPTGFFPQLGRLHHGHAQLDAPGFVELVTDDVLDLADAAQAHGHVGIQARTQLLDQTGTHHQLVADDFGIGRSFFERGDEELRGFHGNQCKGTAGLRDDHTRRSGTAVQ